MRYFVQFSYLGTNYHGSQTQPNGITVQETMEKAFSTILREPVALTFAGRTDAGVHAVKMVAHFDYPTTLNSKLSPQAQLSTTLHTALPIVPLGAKNSKLSTLNSLLPEDIAVEKIWEVSEQMHARFSATSRTYEYRITTVKDPFLINRATRVKEGLDFEAMNKAAAYLIGTHDFASFCKVHTDVKTTLCTVTRAEWSFSPKDDLSAKRSYSDSGLSGEAGPSAQAVFTITADRFLRNMVRAVVGTLFDIGRRKMAPEAIIDILEQKNRCKAGQSAPAEGLYLVDITY